MSSSSSEDDPTETEEVRLQKRLSANKNERRRMQGINNGFDELRGFLAVGADQKVSKAAILRQTVSYIQELLKEKSTLTVKNAQLEKRVSGVKKEGNPVSARKVSTTDHGVPIMKAGPSVNTRKWTPSTAQLESVDEEGAASFHSEQSGDDLQSEAAECREEVTSLRISLENERLHRRNLEIHKRSLQLQNQSLTESERYAQEQYRGRMSPTFPTTPTPRVIGPDGTPRCRTVHRNNLECLVEAIRMREGDNFSDVDDDSNDLTPSPVAHSATTEELDISDREDLDMTP